LASHLLSSHISASVLSFCHLSAFQLLPIPSFSGVLLGTAALLQVLQAPPSSSVTTCIPDPDAAPATSSSQGYHLQWAPRKHQDLRPPGRHHQWPPTGSHHSTFRWTFVAKNVSWPPLLRFF
jgi:hypothetical protein